MGPLKDEKVMSSEHPFYTGVFSLMRSIARKCTTGTAVSFPATRKQDMQSEVTEGAVTLVPLSMSELKSEALTKKKR